MSTQAASFKRLKEETWNHNSDFLAMVHKADAEPQPLSDGTGTIVLDDYSIVIDQMPQSVSPETFLRRLLASPNAAINDHFDWSKVQWTPFPAISTCVRKNGFGSLTSCTLLGVVSRELTNDMKVLNRFDTVNIFSRRNVGPPVLGEIYDIDILGPDNGSVALAAFDTDFLLCGSGMCGPSAVPFKAASRAAISVSSLQRLTRQRAAGSRPWQCR